MLYDDQEDLLSLLVTHTQALAWVMNIVRNNDLVESEIALQVIDEMKRDSRNIWEEQFSYGTRLKMDSQKSYLLLRYITIVQSQEGQTLEDCLGKSRDR